jgi:hypothetical protein
MRTRDKAGSGDLAPAIVALIIAVAGLAGMLLDGFGPGMGSPTGSDAGRTTADAVSRAGAILTPSVSPADRSASLR